VAGCFYKVSSYQLQAGRNYCLARPFCLFKTTWDFMKGKGCSDSREDDVKRYIGNTRSPSTNKARLILHHTESAMLIMQNHGNTLPRLSYRMWRVMTSMYFILHCRTECHMLIPLSGWLLEVITKNYALSQGTQERNLWMATKFSTAPIWNFSDSKRNRISSATRRESPSSGCNKC
jgi:hypothetical protein